LFMVSSIFQGLLVQSKLYFLTYYCKSLEKLFFWDHFWSPCRCQRASVCCLISFLQEDCVLLQMST